MDEDLIFDRAVCGDASEADWDALDAQSMGDPEVWYRLSMALRDHGDLAQAMDWGAEVAESTALPERPRRRWLASSGWLAAAAVVVLWVGSSLLAGPIAPPENVERAASLTPSSSNATVVTELPAVLVGTQPAADGNGVDVTYLRRVVETRRAADLRERSIDEWGQPAVTPTTLSTTQEL